MSAGPIDTAKSNSNRKNKLGKVGLVLSVLGLPTLGLTSTFGIIVSIIALFTGKPKRAALWGLFLGFAIPAGFVVAIPVALVAVGVSVSGEGEEGVDLVSAFKMLASGEDDFGLGEMTAELEQLQADLESQQAALDSEFTGSTIPGSEDENTEHYIAFDSGNLAAADDELLSSRDLGNQETPVADQEALEIEAVFFEEDSNSNFDSSRDLAAGEAFAASATPDPELLSTNVTNDAMLADDSELLNSGLESAEQFPSSSSEFAPADIFVGAGEFPTSFTNNSRAAEATLIRITEYPTSTTRHSESIEYKNQPSASRARNSTRLFTDRSGQFKLNAKAIEYQGNRVLLESLENGRQGWVALQDLSTDDRNWIQSTFRN